MILKYLCSILTVICLVYGASTTKEINEQSGSASHKLLFNSSAISEPLNEKTQVEAQSESEITVTSRHALKSNTSLRLDKNYATLESDSSDDLDLLNDSAEVDDTIATGSSTGFEISGNDDEIVLPKRWMEAPTVEPKQAGSKKNIFKVPKSRNKKTLPQSNMNSIALMNYDDLSKNVNDESSHSSYKNYFHALASIYDHFLWNTSSFNTVTRSCIKDVNLYITDLKAAKSWALKASDASGRYRGLFFSDNDYWLGSKKFCYEINHENENMIEIPRMKFFVIKIVLRFNASANKTSRHLHVGQCLPDSCSTQDVKIIMINDPASIRLNQVISVKSDTKVQSEEIIDELKIFETRVVPGAFDIWKEQKFYIFSFICLMTFLLVVIATIYENKLAAKASHLNEGPGTDISKHSSSKSKAKSSQNEMERCEMSNMNNNNNENDCESNKTYKQGDPNRLGFLSKLLLCFAYGSNSRVILSAKTNSEDSLTCIHGLRLFSLLWTIMVHTYLQIFAIGENRAYRTVAERSFLYQVVGNATYSVDTFFFISGLLVVLLFLRTEKTKRQKLNESCTRSEASQSEYWTSSIRKSLTFIFYRFLRLTPIYMSIIVFTELAMKVVYNDSVFTPGLVDHVNCNKFWWRNILYVNNFYPLNEICLMWSWYLANDFQFYVIAIVLLILSTRFLRLAVVLSVLVLFTSWIVTIYVSLHFKYTHKVSDPFESFDILYDKPWQRFGPYAFGMITGYILYRVKVPPKVPFAINILLWMLSLSILSSIIFGVADGQLSVIVTSFYVSLGHAGWGFSLMWITISCCWKLAEPINNVLSFKGFYPLSRLTYCTYLIHPTVMMIISFRCEAPAHLNHGMVITAFLGNTVISFSIAFILSVMFEAPVIRLLKLCFRK